MGFSREAGDQDMRENKSSENSSLVKKNERNEKKNA